MQSEIRSFASGATSEAPQAWPKWRDRLPSPRLEGGRRLRPNQPTGNAPLISYITVVRNAAGSIQRTIDSVSEQSSPHCEHIVVDGASTDATLEILIRNQDRIAYFVSEPDAGFYQGLNKAISLAAGDLICVLNADDWLEPRAAEEILSIHKGSSDAALYLTAARSHYGWLARKWLPKTVRPASWVSCADVCHNAIYASREAFQKTGPFREDLKIAADFDWIMRAFQAGCRFDYSDYETVHYVHGGMSNDTRAHAMECLLVLTTKFPDLEDTDAKSLIGLFYPFRHHVEDVVAWRPAAPREFVEESLAKYAKHGALQRVIRDAVENHDACLSNSRERMRRAIHPLKRWIRSALLHGRRNPVEVR